MLSIMKIITLLALAQVTQLLSTATVQKEDPSPIQNSPNIHGRHLVKFTDNEALKLSWTIEIPNNKSYLLKIFFVSNLIAIGNHTEFSFLQNSIRSYNGTPQVDYNRTTFAISFYQTERFEEISHKDRLYNTFIAVLTVSGDSKLYQTVTEVAYDKTLCYTCGKLHSFDSLVAVGATAAMVVVTCFFVMWMIREKVAKKLGCQWFIEDPYKPSGFETPKPLPILIFPRFDTIFPPKKIQQEPNNDIKMDFKDEILKNAEQSEEKSCKSGNEELLDFFENEGISSAATRAESTVIPLMSNPPSSCEGEITNNEKDTKKNQESLVILATSNSHAPLTSTALESLCNKTVASEKIEDETSFKKTRVSKFSGSQHNRIFEKMTKDQISVAIDI